MEANMALKEKIVTAAIVISSWFGGGASKAEASERSDAEATNIEVVTNNAQEAQESRGSTYTFSRATPPQKQQKKKKSAAAQAVRNRINKTKQAINNISNIERRRWENEGANYVNQMYRDYRRARAQAEASARQKINSDKRFAKEFADIVSNALVVKYQIDRGHQLQDYIPHNTRKGIMAQALSCQNELYQLLRSNTNEDIIMNYMGQSLQGVAYTPRGNKYEYRGKTATVSGNILDKMKIKSKNYTIGGSKAFSYGGR